MVSRRRADRQRAQREVELWETINEWYGLLLMPGIPFAELIRGWMNIYHCLQELGHATIFAKIEAEQELLPSTVGLIRVLETSGSTKAVCGYIEEQLHANASVQFHTEWDRELRDDLLGYLFCYLNIPARVREAKEKVDGLPDATQNQVKQKQVDERDPEHRESTEQSEFCNRGRTWHIAFAGKCCDLPDEAGFLRLHALLCNQGKEVPVGDLTRAPVQSRGIEQLDRQATLDVQTEMERLEEVMEAGDGETAAIAKERRERLRAELKSSHGLRPRRMGDDRSRAASTVGKSIDRAIRSLRDAGMAELAEHLSSSIVGPASRSPVYRPTTPIHWML
jgi:hypothetical protein